MSVPSGTSNNNGSGSIFTAPSTTTNNGGTGSTFTAPSSNNNVTVTIDTKEMQRELERRQQDLEIKAAELAAREEALRQGGDFRKEPNWPPLPSFCPLKPCFFQDINVDIRPEFQGTVQMGYHLWIGFVLTQILNIFAAVLLLSHEVTDATSNLSFGLMTCIFFVPLTYLSWFRPLYKAFKNDSSFNFMVFFFVFFMQTLVVSLWALGLPTAGPCASWIAYAAGSVYYLLRVHSIYRSSGASMAKARSEFAQGVISNQYVQQTVANAARQTVNQTFAAATATGSTDQQPNVK